MIKQDEHTMIEHIRAEAEKKLFSRDEHKFDEMPWAYCLNLIGVIDSIRQRYDHALGQEGADGYEERRNQLVSLRVVHRSRLAGLQARDLSVRNNHPIQVEDLIKLETSIIGSLTTAIQALDLIQLSSFKND